MQEVLLSMSMCCRSQCAVMKCVSGLAVLLSLLCYQAKGVHIKNLNQSSSDVPDRSVFVDLSAVIRRVDERFLSVTIDASLATDEKFMYLLGWVSVCLRPLNKAVTEAAAFVAVCFFSLLLSILLLSSQFMCPDLQLTSM